MSGCDGVQESSVQAADTARVTTAGPRQRAAMSRDAFGVGWFDASICATSTNGPARLRVAERDVVARVQEAALAIEGEESTITDDDLVGVRPQVVKVDRESERTRDERAVHVDFESVGATMQTPLPNRRSNPGRGSAYRR